MVLTQEILASQDEPYSANQLAHAMWFLCKHPELVEKMEVIDHKTKPDGVTARAWERYIEEEQKKEFDRVLDEVADPDHDGNEIVEEVKQEEE